MNKMNDLESIIIEKRKTIFEHKQFSKYIDILNQMGIPQKFDYKNCIPQVFSDLEYEKIKKFEIEPYSILYKEVLKYTQLKMEYEKKNILILVHPFYPILRHANFLIQFPEYYNKYLEYEEKILEILNNPNSNIILFESPDSFARYTYKFYDIGSVKEVIFTEHSTGKVLDVNSIRNFKYSNNMRIAGCYGENCVKDVENQLEKAEIKRINELIMERAIKL